MIMACQVSPHIHYLTYYFVPSILPLRTSSSVYVCFPRSLSLFAPKALLIRPRLNPTRKAAITVPMPTLPKLCIHNSLSRKRYKVCWQIKENSTGHNKQSNKIHWNSYLHVLHLLCSSFLLSFSLPFILSCTLPGSSMTTKNPDIPSQIYLDFIFLSIYLLFLYDCPL